MALYSGKSASQWLAILERAEPSQIGPALQAGMAFRQEFLPAVPKLIQIAKGDPTHSYDVGICLHYIGTGCLGPLCEELSTYEQRTLDDHAVWIAQTLSRFKLYARPAGPVLKRALESQSSTTDVASRERLHQSAAALADIDPESAVPALTHLIEHLSLLPAIELLGKCGHYARRSLDTLYRYSQDLNPEIAAPARVSIAQIEGNYLHESCPVCPSFDAKRLNALSLLELIGNQQFRLKRKCLRCGHVFT